MSAFSLPKKLIIKKSAEFNEIFTSGELVRSKYFIAFLQRDNNLSVGFTAQKGLKNKVIRNRLKRKTRELWRIHSRNYSITGKIVLLTKIDAEKIKFCFLQEDFKRLMEKLTKRKEK